ncbi:uncharacterized protein LOC118432902 [Folsomia candida]|uniref:uncharacterized protein LOC118432902 n=1 Tax=Folsomia candida TaxID=158441 RepID=UPI000B8F3865|nr:uncharacterized protein LOC118432902 [Folsomia candida]
MVFKTATSIVLFISVIVVTAQNHEKFWAEPEFFASLSDYLTTPQTQLVATIAPERRRDTIFTQQPTLPIPRHTVPAPQRAQIATPSYQTFHIVQHQTWMDPRNPRPFQTTQTFQIPQPRPQIVRNEGTPSQYLPQQPFGSQMVMLPHANALPTEQAKKRRRPLLNNKRKRLRTTTTTTTTPVTTTLKLDNSTQNNATTPSPPPPPSDPTTTTTTAPDYYDYSDEEINNSAHAYHPSPPSPQVVHIHPHSQPHFTSSNAEILPARQVYDSSEQFGIRVPAPSSFHHQLPPPRALHQLNPNILIAKPHLNQQPLQNPPGEQLAQASNLFPVMEQDENFLGLNQQGNPAGIVTRISNILETGRKILYFPVGVVDVVDHALTYAETNPYVSYVMGTLADTILGSTKGMSAAPLQQPQLTNTKPPQTLLIAAKLGEMKENLNRLQNAVASTMQPIKKL